MSDEPSIKVYQVRIADYFAKAEAWPGFRRNAELCCQAITQITERYGLGKSTHILSLGAGDAFEEYWFHRAGCRLTLNDIERAREALFIDLPNGADRYVFGDAGRFVAECNEAFDVLYVSSFHPDEVRRGDIQESFCKQRTEDQRQRYVTWPVGPDPYHPIMEMALNLVRAGGLIIFQHYKGGVDINYNPHYFDAVRNQFNRRRVFLVEEHHFRSSPQHLLLTARKGGRFGAEALVLRLTAAPPITTFHGRYPDKSYSTDVVQSTLHVGPVVLALARARMFAELSGRKLHDVARWVELTAGKGLTTLRASSQLFAHASEKLVRLWRRRGSPKSNSKQS